MSVVMSAALALTPGCKLLYRPPQLAEDPKHTHFYEQHRNEIAVFVGYDEVNVGPLDFQGRMPGRYVSLKSVKVRFEGDAAVHTLNIAHFIVVDNNPAHASFVTNVTEDQRVGDLLHPSLFYPQDTVRVNSSAVYQLSDSPRLVKTVFTKEPFVSEGHPPRYMVLETEEELAVRRTAAGNVTPWEARQTGLDAPKTWTMEGSHLILVSRGNVWALYNDSTQLRFDSDDNENDFWALSGISEQAFPEVVDIAYGKKVDGLGEYPLEFAYHEFMANRADIISASTSSFPLQPPRYVIRCLHHCFAEHKARVRALTERLWHDQARATAA
jgi:hypothetical protein